MPDGAAAPRIGDPADERARAADGRLIRDVRWRLVLWSGLTTLVVLAVLGVGLYLVAASTLEANGVQQLRSRLEPIVAQVENPRLRPNGPEYGFIFGGSSSGTYAIAVDEDGRNLSRGDLPPGLPVDDALTAAETTGADLRLATLRTVGPDDRPALVPVRVRTERVVGPIAGVVYIQVIQDRTAEQQTLDAIRTVLIVGGLVVVLVAFGFGTFYARRALVPIRESLVQQRAALRRQREFAADASHELRTPLTVIRSSVEHLRRNPREAAGTTSVEALDDIDAEVANLTALVEDLLLLARSDSGAIGLIRLPVDLGDIAADGAGALVKAAADRSVHLALDPEPAIVEGDHARLRQLTVILVDNAIRHSPAGGNVRVRVRSDRREAILEVEDDGPGIHPEDMPRVFERFWRAPGAAAGGTGLGLAIAKSIVDLHEGRIVVSNRPEGGARFTVRLPIAGSPPVSETQAGSMLATDQGR